MDQGVLSETDDFEEELLLPDNKRRRLQAQNEEHLRKVKRAYESDQAAENEDIKKKEQELEELGAKYNEELRIKKEALDAVLQRGEARKRKYDGEVKQLKACRSRLERMKPSSEERPEEVELKMHQTSAPSILTYNSEKRAVKKPGSKFNGTPQGQLDASRAMRSTTSFEDSRAHNHPRTRNYLDTGLPDFRAHSLSEPIRQISQAHILANDYNCPSGKNNSAIKELGELVEDCDQGKANASNMEYAKAVKEGGYKPFTMRPSAPRRKGQKTEKSATKRTAKEPNHKPLRMFEGIIDPAVGEVYHAWWSSAPKQNEVSACYPVVILPYSGDCDWKEIGLTFNFWTSELAEELPDCFKVEKVTTDAGSTSSRLTWAKEYQDGGPKVRSRKFPCLFLHPPLKIPSADKEFKLGSQDRVLAFLPAEDLRHESTSLGPRVVYLVLKEYEGLVQAFKTRLRTIRAKRNAALEQTGETFPFQTQSMDGQQQLDAPRSGVQEPRPSTGNRLSMPGDKRANNSARHGPASRQAEGNYWDNFADSYDRKYSNTQ